MNASGPTTLIVETTAAEDCPVDFLGDSADIVYFISFAHSERYGAGHALARAAGIMKRRLHINLSPLLTFVDIRTESSEEEQALETMWQDAGPVADSARSVAAAIEADEELGELTAEFPELPERLRELAQMADWAAQREAQIRLGYVL